MMNIDMACEAFRKILEEQQERVANMVSEKTDFTTKKTVTIGVVDGDGIGPIITAQASRVLEKVLADEIAAGSIVIKQIEGLTIENRMACGKAALETASYEKIADQDAAFRAAYDDNYLYIELKGAPDTRFRMHFEYRLMWPSPGVIFEKGEKRLSMWATTHQSIFGEKIQAELDKYQLLVNEPGHYLIAISRKNVGWEENRPIRVMLAANEQSWIYDDEPVHLLGKNDISPGEFGWLRV